MRLLKQLSITLAACVALNGCIAQQIIGANKRRDLATINIQREQAGLKPLTWEEYNHPTGQ